jgi:hypothetical protein
VDVHGHKGDGKGRVGRQEEVLGQRVRSGDEDGIGLALKAGEDVGAEVL